MKDKRRMKNRLLALFLAITMIVTSQGLPTLAETVGTEVSDTNIVTISGTEEELSKQEMTTEMEEPEQLTEESELKADSASPANPVHHCTKKSGGSDYTDWSYIYFGSYPQTEVTGDALTTAITGAAYDDNGDAWVNGIKYRRISKSDTNYSGYFGDSTYRYFKWNRIKWRVLQNDGNTLFVMADSGLDCKDYHDPVDSITWKSCTLRRWLNNDFYETAFSSAEQGAIAEQTVLNEDNPSYGTEGGNNTSDKVCLLSIGEVTNPSYGFCEASGTYSASRWVQPSSYAHARGVYTGGNATGYWWLRSPGRYAHYAASIYGSGYVSGNGNSVNTDSHAVVPVLHINLSSSLWSLNDDGTSGSGGNASDTTSRTERIIISAPSKKIAAGQKVQLKAEIIPKNATNQKVTWKSSNKEYATVDTKGIVTTKKAGKGKTVTITATAQDDSGIKASIKIKIMKNAVTKVKIKNAPKTLKVKNSITLKTAVFTNGSNANKILEWTSSNSKFATVTSEGRVTAKKAGKGKTVTITAMSTDGTNKKAKVKIKIK